MLDLINPAFIKEAGGFKLIDELARLGSLGFSPDLEATWENFTKHLSVVSSIEESASSFLLLKGQAPDSISREKKIIKII